MIENQLCPITRQQMSRCCYCLFWDAAGFSGRNKEGKNERWGLFNQVPRLQTDNIYSILLLNIASLNTDRRSLQIFWVISSCSLQLSVFNLFYLLILFMAIRNSSLIWLLLSEGFYEAEKQSYRKSCDKTLWNIQMKWETKNCSQNCFSKFVAHD